jgi:hypothetical protein
LPVHDFDLEVASVHCFHSGGWTAASADASAPEVTIDLSKGAIGACPARRGGSVARRLPFVCETRSGTDWPFARRASRTAASWKVLTEISYDDYFSA